MVLLWSYALEHFISTLSYRVYVWLPGGARESLVQHVSAHHSIPPRVTAALTLAGCAMLLALVAAFSFVHHDAA